MAKTHGRGGWADIDPEHVKRVVARASLQTAATVAFQVEAQTRVNIQENRQIDTGFMLNSVYTITHTGSFYGKAWPTGSYPVDPSKHSGQTGLRRAELAPEARMPKGSLAGILVGAEYAIWQELRMSFLYAAAEMVGSKIKGSVVEKIFKGFVRDD